jgi:hypothetical protein
MGEPEAGPALDAAIAERVMGLQPCDAWERINLGRGGFALQKRCQHSNCYPRPKLGLVGGPPWYSTDIATAMAVFEAMVERVGYGHISANMADARGAGFIVLVGFNCEDGNGQVTADGLLPLAICRAALAALGDT